MEFKAIVAPTMTELFEQQIQGMILSGELPIGSKLPTEQSLAETMRISKSTAHAGIKNLERKGFLRIVPRHGVYVADYPRTGNIETLVALLKSSGSSLDRRTMASILQFRECVEGMAVRLLAENHTDDGVMTLRFMISDMRTLMSRTPPASSAALAQMIFEFHLEIGVRSGNNVIPMVLNGFHDVSISYWQSWIKFIGADAAIDFLERFTERVAAGDGDGAMVLYRENASAFMDNYTELM